MVRLSSETKKLVRHYKLNTEKYVKSQKKLTDLFPCFKVPFEVDLETLETPFDNDPAIAFDDSNGSENNIVSMKRERKEKTC